MNDADNLCPVACKHIHHSNFIKHITEVFSKSYTAPEGQNKTKQDKTIHNKTKHNKT